MKNRRGFSVVEGIIGAILLAMLFYVAFRTLSMARQEAVKGFWLQEQIIALRNSTRALGQAVKSTSYPTTLVKSGGEELVFSYKEARSFDDSGRLRKLEVKNDDAMDLHIVSGFISPGNTPQRVMYFPICFPETDLDSYTPGRIVWNELVLEPDPATHWYSGLGRLVLIEREETYTSKGLASRAFSLTLGFKESLPVTRRKELIGNVDNVFISYFSVDELRGIAVTGEGAVDRKMRRRHLVSIRIECAHPRDEKMRIGDQCSVVNNVDISELVGGGMTLVVVSVTGSTAKVLVNGSEQTAGVGTVLGGQLKVTSVKAGTLGGAGYIKASLLNSTREQIFYERK
ncbi:MAG: hypothetical protein GX442_17735 [Candidatus Riflebacteria bacterium]|nr:hypothetical protein [Candidatus Riflebacteria bacterium]